MGGGHWVEDWETDPTVLQAGQVIRCYLGGGGVGVGDEEPEGVLKVISCGGRGNC